ncbi:hypothetical protein [Oryzobacter telluris]|uniref:hypothetical protein n=1 Tax=Oryzobacter telluris TaxID=3149179 RepID=UPI00370D0A07
MHVTEDTSARVTDYLQRMHLWHRYGQERGLSVEQLVGSKVQAQDFWLSDPALPSSSGAITDRVEEEPIQWAIALRLVRAANHTLTDRGHALLAAAAPQQQSLQQTRGAPNPMLLSQGAALIVLYALLEADYDFVRCVHRVTTPKSGEVFSRATASASMGAACRLLREENLRRVRTGEDRQRLTRLKELAESIESAGDAPTRGGARPPDQTSTVRLEPYVDLGLIGRQSRYEYRYLLSPSQFKFWSSIVEQPDGQHWLGEMVVGSYVRGRGLPLAEVEPEQVWDVIRDSWAALRSTMGYASITEMLLLANANLLDQGIGYFELSAGMTALRELDRAHPRSLRFTMARGGKISYVRFNDAGGPK